MLWHCWVAKLFISWNAESAQLPCSVFYQIGELPQLVSSAPYHVFIVALSCLFGVHASSQVYKTSKYALVAFTVCTTWRMDIEHKNNLRCLFSCAVQASIQLESTFSLLQKGWRHFISRAQFNFIGLITHIVLRELTVESIVRCPTRVCFGSFVAFNFYKWHFHSCRKRGWDRTFCRRLFNLHSCN